VVTVFVLLFLFVAKCVVGVARWAYLQQNHDVGIHVLALIIFVSCQGHIFLTLCDFEVKGVS